MSATVAERSFTGPLRGLKVVEIGSIGPGPYCAMLLADLGADVLRVDRTSGAALVGPNADFRTEVMHRGRRSVAVDLKNPRGREVVLDLVAGADALIEGFRPGVTERLGIGPDACAAVNPRLVYGRMTGYGQDGPMAQAVGHDINYIAQSGVLSLLGRNGAPPTPPLSLAGDFGGGGAVLALGIVSAVWEAQRSGRGQVIDAAMVDGSALLAAAFHGFVSAGTWDTERGTNVVDSGAPFYDVYETADGRWLAVGALEAHFYADLLEILEIDPGGLPHQDDRSRWPEMKKVFADAVIARTCEEWVERAAGRGCISPVLEVEESWSDPHNVARGTFVDIAGVTQPVPQPRFSRTPAYVDSAPPAPGENTREALAGWGIPAHTINEWEAVGAVAQTDPPPPEPTQEGSAVR
ncbi:carnitine dehydratase [Nocardioides sp. Root190]|uniref:CaiB/BaiF CoA transferase family protein n=1 Tax=Nocardioides sp. Root190 TaxID=1736488 RepID=UPI0006F993CD|nr:CaiB/BaiF CoA-transferase family protein [Nocardioides sp. Root190]KRB76134.1 carnitine dehydratase [Nocardioides sp. Root190]